MTKRFFLNRIKNWMNNKWFLPQLSNDPIIAHAIPSHGCVIYA